MWITQGILRSIQYRDKLYKQLKLTHPNSSNCEIININLKIYNTILTHTIRADKKGYFENRFYRFKNYIKNTWKVSNEFISKSKHIKKIPFFIDNDTKITDKKDTANKFNHYFTNIGQSITQGIKYKGSKKYSYYLNKNVTSTFTFDHIDEETEENYKQPSHKKQLWI